MNPAHDQEVIYAKGCTSIERLNHLSTRSNDELRMSFFYNPPGDHQIYHVTCEPSEQIKDIDPLSDYTFYYKLDDKIIYQIACILIPNSLIVQFLNKKIYGIELKKGEEQQEWLTFSNVQRNNLEFHLREYLSTSKQINKKKPNVNVLADFQPKL
ncbi:uncharacterized protein OCT59_017012 [Rhizophagus irregularis]|uniref:Uncharacterized protein n=2 Tax=Rhizophagus irregularis TaxID=588596 RepID=U9TVI3_RHIID|nr:hypothetical protein GLOIN_2v1774429 [Rhizophagus irregularis DAOM 181602=DAOM 197198]EXX65168.1 hypothetical protein RirG_135900 [Rhizophagus irregularis DAOM 197198w]UZO24718.1 hypothetical protein OCT59_017012 [Rhizophagus irregularis]POG71747.1 hypothetical protein GLOIN_2v1774429 [Rhizophagus irregularis DAOM 181602=DAOM 197198]CAG8565868.1 3956_t:CDS:1 [Rhizophagus irregularis]GBC14638.1 hypothetical protein GLOIN_2v1774429 [Rhizophagus irregularis DAOM 181602=DAOM 197198]|eukprot:XP_025178613.1 hypothetical protein GLOIN_2v1774429 [Rhizophagus irregularis DAOM 181602=DAOM 197198]